MMNLDEEPVGQHKELGVSEHPTTEQSDTDTATDPLPERMCNKNPKVRLTAMSELFETFSSCDSSVFLQYYPFFHKYLADTHPKVQELANDAFLILIDKCPLSADQTLLEIITVIIEKCLATNKDILKTKALSCLLKLAEDSSVHSMMKETIAKNLNLKANSKTSAASLYTLTQLLLTFGSVYFPVNDFIEAAIELVRSASANVRIEALNFLKEGYHWDKTGITKAIEKLKPIQKEELKKQFTDNSAEPLRAIQTGNEKSIKAEETKSSTGVKNSVLKRFDEHWCEEVVKEKKWTVKRDMLEDLLQVMSTEKIKAENLAEIGKALRQLLQDPNLIVTNSALKVLGQLAQVFKGHFAIPARHSFDAIVQKFKDKKSATEAQKCLENLASALRLDDMIDQIKETLMNKSPLIRSRICTWIASVIFPKVDSSLAKSMALAFTPLLSKLTDDALGEVRDAALSCISAIKYYVPDSRIDKIIGDMTPQKQERISKIAEQISSGKGEPLEIRIRSDSETNISKKSPAKRKQSKVQSVLVPSSSVSKSNGSTVKANYEVITEEDIGSPISPGEATKQVFESVPTMILAQFDMTEWKERQKGFKYLNEWVQCNPDKVQTMIESIIVWLGRKFGSFKSVNEEIIGELLLLLKTMCDRCTINKRFAYEIVPVLMDRMKEERLSNICVEIALITAKSANPSYVAALIIKACYESNRNTAIMEGGIMLLTKLLNCHGAGLLPIKMTVDYSKNCLRDPQLVSAATQYIVAIYKIMGDSIKPWLSDLDESVYRMIEIEFGKLRLSASEVKLDYKAYSTSAGNEMKSHGKLQNNEKTSNHSEKKLEQSDLGKGLVKEERKSLNRYQTKPDSKGIVNPFINEEKGPTQAKVNISKELTTELLLGLSTSLAKHRQESKAAIEKIIQSAGTISANGLASLMLALKGRMSESCKNLLKGFITLVGTLAVAVGPEFKKFTKLIVQPLMNNLSDKQLDIRIETVATIEKISSTVGSDVIANSIAVFMETSSIEGKNLVMTWILNHKEDLKKWDTEALTKALVIASQDKAKEVKELAEQVLEEIVTQLGDKILVKTMKDVKPLLKSGLEQILDKYRFSNETTTKESIVGEIKLKQINAKESELPTLRNLNGEPFIEYKTAIRPDEARSKKRSSSVKPNFNLDSKSRLNRKTMIDKYQSALNSSVISDSSSRQPLRNMSMSRSTSDLQKQFATRKKLTLHELKKFNNMKSNTVAPSKEPARVVNKVIITILENKEGRAEMDKKTKWSTNEFKKMNVDKLNKTLKNCIEANVLDDMFSKHSKNLFSAINTLISALDNEFPSFLDLLDLFCKWAVIKMIEQPNATVLKRILEFLHVFFKKMEETKYQMLDFEAASIVPMLCEKLELPNSNLKQQCKELLRIATRLYNPSKIMGYIMNVLESTKNKKAKLDCLGLAKELAKTFESNKIFIPKDIKCLIKLVNSPENNIKNESLDILADIYNSRGDSIWSLTGRLTEKTKEILKKKFNIQNISVPQKRRAGSTTEDFFQNMDAKMKPSKKRTFSKIDDSIDDQSVSIATVKENARRQSIDREELSNPTIDREWLSPSESESLFSATGKLESEISPYGKLKGSSKVFTSSMDFSKIQDNSIIEIDTLDQALEILKSESISKRVNALMYLNEKTVSTLEEEKECLISHCDKLLTTFADVLEELFNKPVKDIPIRFTKYFMTVVSKVCANSLVIQQIKEQPFSIFIEQIFMKLLYDGLETMGENNEGQYLIKAFNLTVLRVLEFYDPTKLFAILISLFMKYKDISTGNTKMAKLPSLIAKCVLRLAKSISSMETLNIPKVLLSLHEYLLLIPPSAIPKSANDDIGIRMAKTVIYELIKIRGEDIWEDYKIIELHQKQDLHLQRWINLILGSYHSGSVSKSRSTEESATATDTVDELKEICLGLNSQATFQESIKKLSQYTQTHPEMNLTQYFSIYPKPLKDFVLGSLERYNNQQRNATFTADSHDSFTSPNEKGTSVSEYKSKLELLKQKFDIGHKANN